MLRRVRDLEGWTVRSRDGQDLGIIEDFYFDETRWTIRYVAVKAGNWLTGRVVLLSPMNLERVDWQQASVTFALTAEQIQAAPGESSAVPGSREWEAAFASYYSLPYYWAGTGAWGDWDTPGEAARSGPPPEEVSAAAVSQSHLLRIRDVAGQHVHAIDGEIGHVDDFLVDDRTWTIRYLLIDTSNWIGGRSVLVPPSWVQSIDWAERRVRVRVSREAIEKSPEYDPAADIEGVYRAPLEGLQSSTPTAR